MCEHEHDLYRVESVMAVGVGGGEVKTGNIGRIRPAGPLGFV